MSGIFGYIGKKSAIPVVLEGLEKLDHKGYDSIGIAYNSEGIKAHKTTGKLIELKEMIHEDDLDSNVAMGHTRWAATGEPNDLNAHPHFSEDHHIAIVHKGVISNINVFKKDLEKRNKTFKSETDSEILVEFIETIRLELEMTLEDAVRYTMNRADGSYSFIIMTDERPQQFIIGCKNHKLEVGIGTNEYFVASDYKSFFKYTKDIVQLDSNQMMVIDRLQTKLKDKNDILITPKIQRLSFELDFLEKAGYEHYMLKEIIEQPYTIADCMRGRWSAKTASLDLPGFHEHSDRILKAKRIKLVAIGSSFHAGEVAKYLMETLAKIPVDVDYASEFRYRDPIINKDDIFIFISKSGETADTIASLDIAKAGGALILAVCNTLGSSLAKDADAVSFTHVGNELGIGSTKAFTAELTVLTMIALYVGHHKKVVKKIEFRDFLFEMERIPAKADMTLKSSEKIRHIAELFKDASSITFLGRGYNYPVACEAALKIKEIAEIHSDAIPAAEVKHGSVCLIKDNEPYIVIATNDVAYKKIISNIKEIKALGGKVIAIINQGDPIIPELVDHYIEIPRSNEALTPILSVIPLQLFAYYIALYNNCDIDTIRNEELSF